MSRKEEIIQEANTQYNVNHPFIDIAKETFIEAAQWADKTMIEKFLDFIHENFYDHPHENGHICSDSFQSLEKLEEELIKAIES